MKNDSKAEFDDFATSYQRDLRKSLGSSEIDDEYFASYKVALMRARCAVNAPRILDFGCGIGRSFAHLQHYFPKSEIVGYDVSEESLRIAATKYPTVEFSSKLEGLGERYFDAILAANVFHHIPPQRQTEGLVACRKLLTPEVGRLYFFEHNPLNPVTKRIFERCPFDQDATMIPVTRAISLASSAQLQVLRKQFTLFFPKQLSALRGLESLLSWLPLGAQYFLEMAASPPSAGAKVLTARPASKSPAV